MRIREWWLNFSLQTWMKIEVMHRAKCWNVHQVPKWPIRDRLNRLHDFGCKTMQIRSSGSPMRWRPQQSSLQPALHRTTSLVEAPYELYNHSCHMHQTKFHIIQIKRKKSGHAQQDCAAFLVVGYYNAYPSRVLSLVASQAHLHGLSPVACVQARWSNLNQRSVRWASLCVAHEQSQL